MQPENPPPPPNYPGYPPPPVNGPVYAPPPPRTGMPVWAWVLISCLGGCFLIFVVFAAILFPVFAQARTHARETSCLSNVKQIELGTLMYAQDYDERFPIATTWQTGVYPYIKNERVFHCPEVGSMPDPSAPPSTDYAFNSVLDMMKQARLGEPANTISTYDSSTSSQNANDALTSLPTPGRHLSGKGNNVGFTDGHAKFWPDSEPLPKGEILPDTP